MRHIGRAPWGSSRLLDTVVCCCDDRDSCEGREETQDEEGLQNRNHETFSNTKMLFTLLICMVNLSVQKGSGCRYGVNSYKTKASWELIHQPLASL